MIVVFTACNAQPCEINQIQERTNSLPILSLLIMANRFLLVGCFSVLIKLFCAFKTPRVTYLCPSLKCRNKLLPAKSTTPCH